MHTFVLVILIIFLLAAALLAGLLFVPLTYVMTGRLRERDLGAEVGLKVFGFLGLSGLYQEGSWKLCIQAFQASLSFSPPWQKKEKLEEKKKKEEEKEDFPFQAFLKYSRHLADRELLAGAWNLFKNLFRVLKPQNISLEGQVGFYEPHLTGMLAAFLCSVKGACPKYSSSLELVWDEEVFDLEMKAEGKVLLAAVLFHLLRFLLAKKTRRAWKKIKKEKKASRLATT